MRRRTYAHAPWLGCLLVSFSLAACATGSNGTTTDAALDVDASSSDADPLAFPDVEFDPDAESPGVSPFDDAGAEDAATDAPELPPCEGMAAARGDVTLTIPYRGLLRTALVHIPPGYEPANRTPLVLNFHGFSSDAFQQAVYTRMNPAVDRRGAIAVHPYGIGTSWNAGQCCGTAWLDGVDDVGFVGALLDRLESQYCVDTRRVWATGMSNGGFLAHRLACEMSDRIAAIASVTGVLGVPPAACNPPRAVPVMQIHGTEDPLVPYRGGNPVLRTMLTGELDFRSVADTVLHWRTHDMCPERSTIIFRQGDATCERWGVCNEGSEVILCTIGGGGHTWPGATIPVPLLGRTSRDLDATNTVLDFFFAHPMP